MKPHRKQENEITRLAEYLISGGAYFWTGYVVFFFGDTFWGLSLWWAKLIANLAGWTVNFLLQRYWVFKNPSLSKHQTEVTGRYVFITLVDFVLDYMIVAALKSAGLTPYVGQFVSSGFFTVWNYFWYRFWVFPEKFAHLSRKRMTTTRVVAHRPLGHGVFRG